MTTIILNGANGKMGKNIIEIVENNKEKYKIVAGVDKNIDKNVYDFVMSTEFKDTYSANVIIDFSHPDSLNSLLEFSKKKRIPLVIATTGYSKEQIEKIEVPCKEIPIFFTFNMSVGINLLIDLVKKSYKALQDGFDIEIVEKHHNQKIDAPSGTALMIADAINKEANKKFEYMQKYQAEA